MKNKYLKIDFSEGEFAEHVTGAAVYLPDLNILLECGFSQSNSLWRDYKENKAKFKFSCKELKAVFVSHCHLDHIGRIPLLYKRGCKAPIIVSKGSKAIIKNMLEDSAKILEREALLLTKQKEKLYEPIYNLDDVNNALAHVQEYEENIVWAFNEEIKFRFIPAGHIRYSEQIELFVNVNNCQKKLVYTGDLGNYILPKLFSNQFQPIESCDVLIAETTYGDKNRGNANAKMRKKDIEKLETVIQQFCIENKRRILIPCFALDRTPEMYMVLREILERKGWDIPILIDSPLSVKQFNIYKNEELILEEELAKSRTYLCSDYQESAAFQHIEGGMIILSSSGMLNAGRVLQYLPRILPNPRNCIVFCGYATEGTLAYEIKHGNKKVVEIAGKKVKNNAQIVMLNSFSSHMQHDQLLDYYSNIKCNKIYLVHGQQDSKTSFAHELKSLLEKKNKTTQVICVNKGTEGKL